jgi:outer membrane protein TolC
MKAHLLIATFLLAGFLPSQAQGPLQLNLQQAMDMAAKQSYSVQVNELEAQRSYQRVKEVLSIGMPQVNAQGSLQNYLDVPTQVVPNFFGGEPELIRVQFGVPWSAFGGIRLDQLIFDGTYLLGLKAAQEVRKQSDEELERQVKNARVQAAKAYYGVLAADEGARIINETMPVLERSVRESEIMSEQGFIEGIDVDRLKIELTQARDQKMVFERQGEIARDYLRFVLGIPAKTPIELTDQLEQLIESPAEVALSEEPLNLEQHVDLRMANTVYRIQTLEMRGGRAAYLPSLNGFFSHQQQWNANTFEPISGPIPWFPATLWGVNLNVPIFSSGARSSRFQQARLGLKQAEVNRTMTEERLRLEHLQRRNDVVTAQDLYRSERERMELAKNVFDRTSLKFTEGVSSSFELTQEQGSYINAQRLYIQRLVDLVNARTELRRALDRF